MPLPVLSNGFLWSADNFAGQISDTLIGTSITTGAANTKGSDTEILSDTVVTQDVYGMAIGFSGGNSSTNVRMFLVDLKADPAGGTSYTTIISNLAANCPSMDEAGYWYYFPLFAKAGTAFAMAAQCNAATQTVRGCIKVFGKPTRPEMYRTGSFVRTFGATTASTTGTTVSPGSGAYGSYSASLGTTADNLWWWQGGLLINDSSQGATSYWMDIAAGDASNKVMCAEGIKHQKNNTTEEMGKDAYGLCCPWQDIASGANVYIRAACTGTTDSSVSGVVYGVGG